MSNGSRPGSVFGALRWAAAGSIGAIALKVVILAILSRLLPPEEFGVYSIALAIVMIVSVVAQVGIPTNLIVIDEVNASTVVTGLSMAVGSAALIGLASVVLTANLMPDLFARHWLLILASLGMLVVQVAVNVLQALFQRKFAFQHISTNDLTASLIGNGVVAVGLALAGYGVGALVGGQLVYLGWKLAFLVRMEWRLLVGRPTMRDLSALAHGGVATTVAEVANMATVHAQRPLVAYFLGAAGAGLWSRVYQVNLIQLSVVLTPIEQVMLPLLSRARKDRSQLDSILSSSIQAVSLSTLPISLLTAAWAPILVPAVFGPAWTPLVTPLQIGSVILFFRGLDRILLSASRAVRSMRSRAVFQLVQLALVIGILIPTAPMGLVAASWGYVAALLMNLLLTFGLLGGTGILTPFQAIGALKPSLLMTGGSAALCGLTVLVTPPAFRTVTLALVATVSVAASFGIVLIWRRAILFPVIADALDSGLARVRGRGFRRFPPRA